MTTFFLFFEFNRFRASNLLSTEIRLAPRSKFRFKTVVARISFGNRKFSYLFPESIKYRIGFTSFQRRNWIRISISSGFFSSLSSHRGFPFSPKFASYFHRSLRLCINFERKKKIFFRHENSRAGRKQREQWSRSLAVIYHKARADRLQYNIFVISSPESIVPAVATLNCVCCKFIAFRWLRRRRLNAVALKK